MRLNPIFKSPAREREVRAAIHQGIDRRVRAMRRDTGQLQACRVCGCTEDRACVNRHGVACHWIESDLCCACVEPKRKGGGRG